MALFLVLFIGVLGITFWKVGLFTAEPPVLVTGPGAVPPPTPPTLPGNSSDTTKKAPAPLPPIPKSDNKNPAGYTVLEKAKSYITEGGYTTPSNGATYRYFNGKWETKNGTSWIRTTTREKEFLLAKCFSKNATPVVPVTPTTAPAVTKTLPVRPAPAAICDCERAVIIGIEAIAAKKLLPNARKYKKNELIESIFSFYKTCATHCATEIWIAQNAIDAIR